MTTAWPTLALEELASVQRGKFSARPRNDPRYYGGEIPFIQTGDVANGAGRVRSYSQTLNADGLSVSKLFPKGSLVVTIAANIGDVAEVAFDFACPDSLVVVQANEGTDSKWLQYSLESKKALLDSLAPQNAQKNINLEVLRRLPLDVPPLEEQKRIAGGIKTWDTAIETTERLIAAKKRYYTHELSRLISRGQHPRTHVGAVVREVSERNRCGHLLRLGDLLTESREPDTEQNPAKRLTVRLHLQGVEARPARGTESDGATTFYRRRAGQLIYGKQNIFRGAIGIIPHELDGYCSTQDLPAFNVDATVNAEWLYYWLSRENFYKSLESLASGSGSKRLHPEEFFNIKIELPDLATQTAIARYLNALREEIGLLGKSLDALKRQKRGLMQKLLTGKWRIQMEEGVPV